MLKNTKYFIEKIFENIKLFYCFICHSRVRGVRVTKNGILFNSLCACFRKPAAKMFRNEKSKIMKERENELTVGTKLASDELQMHIHQTTGFLNMSFWS